MSKLYLRDNMTEEEYLKQASLDYKLTRARNNYEKALIKAAQIIGQIGQAKRRGHDIYTLPPWLDEMVKDASYGLVCNKAFKFDIMDRSDGYGRLGVEEITDFFNDKQKIIDLEPVYSDLIIKIAEAIYMTYAKFCEEKGLPS